MVDAISNWLDVRDKLGFLNCIMTALAGDARVSFEGDVSQCRFPEELEVSREEVGVLKRNTIHPRQDFTVLRLTPESIAPIFAQVTAASLTRAIVRVPVDNQTPGAMGWRQPARAPCRNPRAR